MARRAMSTKSKRRARRQFTKDYKVQVVGLVRESGLHHRYEWREAA